MATIIQGMAASLPRDIDVKVSVSKPQAESTVDLSVLALVGRDGFPDGFSHDASRVRYYSTLSAVEEDFAVSSEPYKAAVAFFAQSPRARTMAIARVFDSAQAAYLQCGPMADKTLAQWQAITNGSFKMSIDGVEKTISNLSFSAITDTGASIASAVQTALRGSAPITTGYTVSGAGDANANGTYTPVIGVEYVWSNANNYFLYHRLNLVGKHQWTIGTQLNYQSQTEGIYISAETDEFSEATLTGQWTYNMDAPAPTVAATTSSEPSDDFSGVTVVYADGALRITSGTAGDESAVSFMSETGSGTDLSGLLGGTEEGGAYVVAGYDPNDLEGGAWNFPQELEYVRQAGLANGRQIYAWALAAELRLPVLQMALANWVEGQTYGLAGLVTNSPNAKSASSASDIGSLVKAANLHRVFTCYHNNAYFYPEVSIIAYALGVDYSMADSTITTKFKVLQGIPTVPLTESELSVLESKRINTYTLVGVSARTFREGVEGDSAWYIDDLVNLDNFREDLQVAVYNVFLRNKKVPYNTRGVTLLYSAMDQVCQKYVYNGTFTERPLTEQEKNETGLEVEAPYTIDITPIQNMTIADRASRIGPPAYIKVNLAGAIHSITIGVEAYV